MFDIGENTLTMEQVDGCRSIIASHNLHTLMMVNADLSGASMTALMVRLIFYAASRQRDARGLYTENWCVCVSVSGFISFEIWFPPYLRRSACTPSLFANNHTASVRLRLVPLLTPQSRVL